MISGKTFKWSIATVMLLLFLVAGCANEVSTYKLVTDSQRKIEYEGSLATDPAFKGGTNQKRLEMTFDQQVQSINKAGNAITKITFRQLKYSEKNRGKLLVDFDSTREKDKDNIMAKLIGTSYIIEVTPSGQLANIIDTNEPTNAIAAPPSVRRYAIRLVRPEAIKERHNNIILPTENIKKLQKDNKWSDTKILSFGMMGPKSYEKIYTVKEVKSQDKKRFAMIEMNAIPAAEQVTQEQPNMPKIFDNINEYTGELKLNLETGKVEKYFEELKSEWLIIDPEADEESPNPDAIKMAANRLYKLEKIN
ncbi:MAG: hypothetical protein KAS75_03605 [Planctomycetes bacterium]|nr:hypothetical protein [Planctomycetota bacterium]